MTPENEHLTEDRNLSFVQLTSLRAVASMAVLGGHVMQSFRYHAAPPSALAAFLGSIIYSACNASGAVVFFFVLSGCVLSLSLQNMTAVEPLPVAAFYVRRFFRLYPMLWVSLPLAIASVVASRHLTAFGVIAQDFTRNLDTPMSTAKTILSAAGAYTRYNGPMWSIRVELVFSILVPFFVPMLRKRLLRAALLLVFLVVALLPIPSQTCLQFGLSFALGAIIPMVPLAIGRRWISAALAALVMLVFDRVLLGSFHPHEQIFDTIEGLSAFVIIRSAYSMGQHSRILTWRPLVRLGEVSYGVYLLHVPILFLVYVVLERMLGLAALVTHPFTTQIALGVLTIGATLPMSFLTYRVIELPVHNLGRRLSRRIMRHQKGRVPMVPTSMSTTA